MTNEPMTTTTDADTLQLTAKLFTKVLNMMEDVESIPKLGKAPAEMGGYAYVRDPEVKEAVRAGMIKHKLMWLPECTGITQEPQSHNAKRLHTHSTFTVTLVDTETGFTWSFPWFGEALDGGDKGFGKSSTLGFKSLWRTMLLIAEDNDPDGDGSTSGASTRQTDGQPGRVAQAADPKAYKMRFGMHKGKTISEIGADPKDATWLTWALENLDDDERNAELFATIRAYLGMVDSNAPQRPAQGGDPHWTETQDWGKFYAYAGKLGLKHDDVHSALEVDSAKNFSGSKAAAMWALTKYAMETIEDWASRPDMIVLFNDWCKEMEYEFQKAQNALVGGQPLKEFVGTMAVAKNLVQTALAPF